MTRLLVVVLALLACAPAQAHRLLPAYLQLTEGPGTQVEVAWKVPVKGGAPLTLVPRLPAHCAAQGQPVRVLDGGAARSRWWVDCGAAGLVGHAIQVEGLTAAGSDVVVRIEHADGAVTQGILHPDAPTLHIEAEPGAPVLWRYLPIGVEHILLGPDHLLFVLGLLLVIRLDWRRIVATLSAFTVAHSLTLALAVSGLVQLPQGAVEAIIAMSILFLAVEIARGATPETSLTARRPWAVAGACGLIHGLGFAGALAEVGLPPDAIPSALLLFNLGVEAGQLLFVAAIAAAVALAAHVPRLPAAHLRLAATYLLGTAAAFWTVERTLSILL